LSLHWDHFAAAVPWILDHDTTVTIGPSHSPGYWEPASGAFSQLFPALERALKRAFVAPIDLDGGLYVLFTWQRNDGGFCSWLSPAPSANPPTSLYPDHQTLLASFGGIVERSNEPTWWVLNHNDVLTEREGRYDATFIKDYSWAFERASLPIRIELKQFYSIAREANGNTTLCDRATGEVILFAPDHAFDHIEALPGYPDYTLYRFLTAEHFREWVNVIAQQWYDWTI
jgi:hypothetical protein